MSASKPRPPQAPARPFSLFAADASKAYFERFSLTWAPLSLLALLVGVLGSGLWRRCGRDEYLAISVALCLPGLIWPVLFPCAADAGRPYAQRFWVKAALWVAIFSFYGNYFWTHYFYSLLGAKYLFDSYMLNEVPVVCYFCTYFYFTFYFSFSNVVLRLFLRLASPLFQSSSSVKRLAGTASWAVAVFTLSVATAVFEAVSIEHFPLYTYTDRTTFMTVGSVFYGIYFMFGFPMFFVIDEEAPILVTATPSDDADPPTKDLSEEPARPALTLAAARCTLWHVAQNAFATVALVTLTLDLWRIFIGDIHDFSASISVPFVYQKSTAPSNYLDTVYAWLPTIHSSPAPTPKLELNFATQGLEWIKSLSEQLPTYVTESLAWIKSISEQALTYVTEGLEWIKSPESAPPTMIPSQTITITHAI